MSKLEKIKGNKPIPMGGASHPANVGAHPAGTGAAAPQPSTPPALTQRGAGTVVTEDAGSAVGAGVKPTSQPMLATDGPDHPADTKSHPAGTGAAAVQPTTATTNYVPGNTGSPTQNRRSPDGGVPTTKPLGPTPK